MKLQKNIFQRKPFFYLPIVITLILLFFGCTTQVPRQIPIQPGDEPRPKGSFQTYNHRVLLDTQNEQRKSVLSDFRSLYKEQGSPPFVVLASVFQQVPPDGRSMWETSDRLLFLDRWNIIVTPNIITHGRTAEISLQKPIPPEIVLEPKRKHMETYVIQYLKSNGITLLDLSQYANTDTNDIESIDNWLSEKKAMVIEIAYTPFDKNYEIWARLVDSSSKELISSEIIKSKIDIPGYTPNRKKPLSAEAESRELRKNTEEIVFLLISDYVSNLTNQY